MRYSDDNVELLRIGNIFLSAVLDGLTFHYPLFFVVVVVVVVVVVLQCPPKRRS